MTYPNGTLSQIRRGRIVRRVMPISSPHPPPRRSGTDLSSRSAAPTHERPVRLFIGDGDSKFRSLIRATAAADPRFDVVGEADDGELALRLLRWLRPDVALLDADLPSLGGNAVARILSREIPELRVVVLARDRKEAWV
jgi:hypothetical protein